MGTTLKRQILAIVVAFSMVVTMIPPFAYAAGESSANNAITVTTIDDAIKVSYDGEYEKKDASTHWFKALDESTDTPSITKVYLTNIAEDDGYLSFKYNVGAGGGYDVFGSVKSDDGIIDATGNIALAANIKLDYPGNGKEAVIKSGETLTITVTSATEDSYVDSIFALFTDTISFEPIYTSADVTFEAAEHGTYTVDGADKIGQTVTVDKNSDGTWPLLKLAATPDEGYQFLQWVDGDGKFLSSEAEYSLEASNGDMTVKAVFGLVDGPQYKVGDMRFDDWDKAMEQAESSDDKEVILLNDATLTAGEYEIPAGVTFVVPFDEEGTIYRENPECFNIDEWVSPSAFRTLTLEADAEIIVNGELSVPAPHVYAAGSKKYGSAPHKAYGHIAMKEGSDITINDGGTVYAYGYITGEGAVEAKSGATVYEYFQLTDFKGGSATTHLLTAEYEQGKRYRILPLSQYYVQNIEVPLTIHAGAQEYGYSSVFMGMQLISSAVGFIGNEADMMFKLESGTLTKSYDGTTDRLVAEVNGDLKISPMSIEEGNLSVDSEDFVLPINNNITIKANAGNIDITQDIALLPGTEMYIGKNATCNVSSKIYVYDSQQWVGKMYVTSNRKDLEPLTYVPGRKAGVTRTSANLTDAKLQVAGTLNALNGAVYTTTESAEDGADICGVEGGVIKLGQGTETNTWQFRYVGAAEVDSDYGDYDSIPITNAKLHNGDGTYQITKDKYMSGTYTYTGGTWVGECNHSFVAAEEDGAPVVVAPTCEAEGYTLYKCKYDCGATEKRDIVAAKNHAWNEGTVTLEPTCVTEGTKLYTCGNCGTTKTETIEAKGHTPGPEATCTTAQTCTVCPHVIVAALGHKEELIPAVAPTCTNTGLTAGFKCSECNEILTEQTEVPVIDHSWDAGKVTIAATCTTDGVKTYTCTADDCDATKTEDIPAGHIWDETDKHPTCTEAGAGATCTVCGETIDEVPALGHSFTNYEVTATDKVATCTAKGTETAVCDNGCGLTNTRETAMLPHKEITVSAVPATCTATGLTAGTKCEVCEIPIVAQTVVPKAEHSAEAIPAVAPTCKDTGLTEGMKCKVCGEETVKQEKVPALNHPEKDRVVVPEIPPTCKDSGLGVGEKCGLCGEFTIPQITLPVREHEILTATCTEPARCKYNCGYTEGEALGHQFIELEEQKPFCDMPGMTAGTKCIVCNIQVGHEEIPALGHDWVTVEEKAPTFSDIGWSEHQKCTRCLEKIDYEEYEQLGASIKTYDEFIENLEILETWAQDYIKSNPGKDPLDLVIKYIRTGVKRYNGGSWNMMAGYEDENFKNYVAEREDNLNSEAAAAGKSEEDFIKVTGLKNIKNFTLSNGDYVDFGHMFGTMDITYNNNYAVDNADVGGWAGDIVDLLSLADFCGTGDAETVDQMADYIKTTFLGKERAQLAEEGVIPNAEEDEDGNIIVGHYNEGVFSNADLYGDLDAYYIMKSLQNSEYEAGDLTNIMKPYFTSDLTTYKRAAYLISTRLNGATLREELRTEVYHAYTANSAIGILENTRDWQTSDSERMELRKAACYAFADYICEIAGDYVNDLDNEYYDVVSSEKSTLAPGITQTIYKATSEDGKNMSYYTATCDVTRSDVQVCANYSTRPIEKDANGNYKWGMMRVLEQAQNAQKKYGNPSDPEYINNFNIVAAINAGGYDMSDGTPGGLLVMEGIEYYPVDAAGFFGILKDGSAIIGTKADYNKLKAEGKVKEAIGGFGTTLVKDGKVAISRTEDYYTQRASRTAIGITKTGKVVFMVLDGRQGGNTLDDSCGGSMQEIAQIMLDAGCVEAINLDGGGSSTFVSKEEGATELAVINKPSDGAPRSISTSLFVASTAPSSTEFDHAIIDTAFSYLTVGTTIDLTATGVSATNNVVDLPEGIKWEMDNNIRGTLEETEEGAAFTAKAEGTVKIKLTIDGVEVGNKTITVVKPDNLYFTRPTINTVHLEPIDLPIKAVYNNKPVAINEKDIEFSLSDNRAGELDGFTFTPAETEIKNVKIIAKLPHDANATSVMTAYIFSPDEASFDFEDVTAGSEQFAWNRDLYEDLSVNYTFGIDMTKIEMPERLAPLTYMLPGADMEDASAWMFLCNLAERMSDQSYVKATVKFDKNVDVDYSDLTIVNEYFTLDEEGTVFDEETNTLVMKLNWIKQSKPINADLANPICILSGIKLSPKDGAEWDEKGQLKVVNEGNVSYKIYMRASGLYTFASKPSNQEKYGLYEYIHPENDAERGGYFESVYDQFTDEYTLDKSVKNGWMMGNGGWRYYVDDKMLTGIQEIDGKYYKFDEETGLNKGQRLYTGEYFKDSKEYYINNGLIFTGVKGDGWVMMKDGEFRFYNPDKGGAREKVTAKEKPSTCIIDGYCDYTSASGATYHQPYDDAGGHEYEIKSGKTICTECGWRQYAMSECNPTLNSTKATWEPDGGATVGTKAVNPTTKKTLTKTEKYRDYYTVYEGNEDVGDATATLTAAKYGVYVNMTQWRGNYRETATLHYTVYPASPDNVTYTVSSKYLATVTWDANPSATKYIVQYSTNGGSSWKTAKTTTDTKYTRKLSKSTRYKYMFRVKSVGEGLDRYGNLKTYEALSSNIAKLKAPKMEKAVNILSTGKPKIYWTKVPGANKYYVYRAKSENGTYSKIGSTTKNYYTDNGASATYTYFYKVAAVNTYRSKVKSDYSDKISKLCRLKRPVVTLSNKTKKQIKVSWKSVTNADSYNIYKKIKGGEYEFVKNTSLKYWYDKDVTKGKTYYYKVEAVDKYKPEAISEMSLYKYKKCR